MYLKKQISKSIQTSSRFLKLWYLSLISKIAQVHLKMTLKVMLDRFKENLKKLLRQKERMADLNAELFLLHEEKEKEEQEEKKQKKLLD